MVNETNNKSAFVCPMCGKEFGDVHAFAEHMCNHSIEEKNRKAEEEKKQREEQKQRDTDQLKLLKKRYEDAFKLYADTKAEYDKKYYGATTKLTLGGDSWDDLARDIERAFKGLRL